MSDPELFTNTHVTVTLGDGTTVEGFFKFDMPRGTLQIPEIMSWDAQGKPIKTTTSGLVSWNPISGSRYQTKEASDKLHDLWKKAIETPKDAKEDYQIEKQTKDGQPLETWTLKGAYISEYGSSAQEAGGNQISTIDVTIHYDDATKM
jgi:hypothetical protein